jgi:hypothetical protein
MQQEPGFSEVSDRYEMWRARRIPLIDSDVQAKYARMSESPWLLARGAYHRYATQFRALAPALAQAPVAVSVGDLHVENFGTWRDRSGRLVWGVHGLDEVDLLPYTADLVRLASTALLAVSAGLLDCLPDRVSPAILSGWSDRIDARRPRPFVLGVEHRDLYELHAAALLDPVSFETAIADLPAFERALPKPAARMLASVTPAGDFRPQLRRAGADFTSLGARRIIAVATMARSACGLSPSAFRCPDWSARSTPRAGWPPNRGGARVASGSSAHSTARSLTWSCPTPPSIRSPCWRRWGPRRPTSI